MTQIQISTALAELGLPILTRVFIFEGSAYEIVSVKVENRLGYPITAVKMLGGTRHLFSVSAMRNVVRV